jgi:hypothetical protein
MQRQIDAFADNVEHEHVNAVKAINRWWNTTSSWSPYEEPQTSARR